MTVKIQKYSERDITEVTAFNARLKKAGVSFQFPERHEPERFCPIDSGPIRQDYYLAIEDSSTVHGGYFLKGQEFLIGGNTVDIGNYQLPLSEGTIDKRYNIVGLQMLTDALKRQPLLYALGMGGTERPLPMMLAAMGWRLQAVPFFFCVVHPSVFLRQSSYLRRHGVMRLLCDISAATGLGWLGIKSIQASRRKKPSRMGSYHTTIVDQFEGLANRMWSSCRDQYSFASVRNDTVLDTLYPPDDERFIRLIVKNSDDVAIGWAVMLDTQMSDHKQFGNMRVGSIVDCWAAPELADTVIVAATDYLEVRGVDIIVSNQSHPWWCSAMASAGFLEGPSNFALATSPKLTERIAAVDTKFDRVHTNRGDGDGPINL
ncbi:MAG: hypothetical protein KOO62_11515 [candidate division Zixibacteria bacterium]|nr:hypothetical protein [candidate division Zixibacteria bacterium]